MGNRLSKWLAAAGVASRRECEALIFGGDVSIDGVTIFKPQTLVSGKEDIRVRGKKIAQIEEKVYFILNKPKGYICTNAGQKRVIDLFHGVPARLFTIGRLDRDTEGLLLLTNDGHFAQEVIHPSSNIEKEYLVKTNHEISGEHLNEIQKGTFVEGVRVVPLKVKKVRRGTLKVIVAEGKKREVRLLVENAGLKVLHLSRIRIGGLKLGTLPVGMWRPLKKSEREQIFN